MDYGEVLSKAWRIIWKHKVLWLFGILAGLGSFGGNSSGGGGRGQASYQFSENELPPGLQGWANAIERFFENIPAWVWVLLVIAFFVLLVVVIFLTTIGKVGLIQGASLADEGHEPITFGALFSAGMRYFWRVFFLNLLVGLAIAAAFILLMIPIVLLGVATLGIGLICLAPIICLLVPLSWLINVVLEQANIAIILENRGILDGLQRGWQVVTGSLGQYIVMAFILFIGSFIASLLIGLPMVLIVLPAVLGIVIGNGAIQGGLIVSLVVFVLYLPILLLLNGIVQSYVNTAWTLTFRRLTGRAPAVVIPGPELAS